ncbi:MAG: RrF2 family transcriptional regulator [Anaerolineales bacterium]
MQITRQADYAVRAVLYLAQLAPGRRASTAQIARDQSIPVTFLAKIVSQLAGVGIVRATRGAHGGVTLARPAEEINLLEIVEAIDGPVLLNDCVLDHQACTLGDTCAVRPIWCEAQAELASRLRQTTFAQLRQATGKRQPTPTAELQPA